MIGIIPLNIVTTRLKVSVWLPPAVVKRTRAEDAQSYI